MTNANLSTPSTPLLGHYRSLLRRWHPFADMEDADVQLKTRSTLRLMPKL